MKYYCIKIWNKKINRTWTETLQSHLPILFILFLKKLDSIRLNVCMLP